MRYYVYIHSTPEGEPFYVGKGCDSRAFSAGKRPWGWVKRVTDCGGVNIRIVKHFETESEAFAHEVFLIQSLRDDGFDLLNETTGGSGVRGYKQSEETRLHKSKMMNGYKHKTVVCPNCGVSGGETAMKRWHFDKCQGVKKYKARTTVDGKRIFLGNYATKNQVAEVVNKYLGSIV